MTIESRDPTPAELVDQLRSAEGRPPAKFEKVAKRVIAEAEFLGHDHEQAVSRFFHDHPNCPGDDWVACHDGMIYEPCESPYCYGADTAAGACTCKCHNDDRGFSI